MRAIKIDSINRTISEIEITKSYKDLQAIVDGTITIAFYYPDQKHICFVNDEGLLNNPTHFFLSKQYPQPLAGNAVIVGNTPNGNSKDCKLTIDEVKDSIKFLTLLEVQIMIRKGEADYNTYFKSSDGVTLVTRRDLGAFDQSDD